MPTFTISIGFCPPIRTLRSLIWPAWPNGFSIGLLFVVIVSAGAVFLSVLLWAAAIWGLNQYARFDATAGVFTYGYETGVTNYGERKIPFAEIEDVSLKTNSWTDGPPSYGVTVKITRERVKELPAASKEETERCVSAINEMLRKVRANQ